MQKRMLAKLSDGLLTSEGEQWRRQRRVLAPIFAPASVRIFAPAILEAVAGLVERWRGHEDGSALDVAAEVTLQTLDVLERTIFSDGLGHNTETVRDAIAHLF